MCSSSMLENLLRPRAFPPGRNNLFSFLAPLTPYRIHVEVRLVLDTEGESMRPAALRIPVLSALIALIALIALFLAAETRAAPETLTFAKGEAETLQVRIDYDRLPDIAPSNGGTWQER